MSEVMNKREQISCTLSAFREKLAQPKWTAVAICLLSLFVSIPSLWLAALSYPPLVDVPLFWSYFTNPMLMLLNILPPLVLLWIFTFLWNRPWAGYLTMLIPGLALPVGNYFKVAFRGDPVILSDLTLLSAASRVAGGYTMVVPAAMWVLFFFTLVGLGLAIFLLPRRLNLGWKKRVISVLVSILVAVALYFTAYTSQICYDLTANEELVDSWSTSQYYLSRGIWYPFLNSGTIQPVMSTIYLGDVETLLNPEEPADAVAEEEKVYAQDISVVSIMLEGFADFTNFEEFAQYEGMQEAYSLWHQLEEESLYGDLVTNIFGGGTVNTEWGFLSGMPDHQEFTHTTDSYVWYFREQGYTTQGSHPGNYDFYNRVGVNEYLGFEQYRFYEDYYYELGDMFAMYADSDDLLVDCILSDLTTSLEEGRDVFSFSVSLQNHGPYEAAEDPEKYLTADTGISEDSRGWLQTYLDGIVNTQEEMMRLRDELEAMDEPVVLVLFGDHLPWMGNGYEGYYEAGVSFELATEEGFFNYYSTPYIIWANSAAQEALGGVETGDGGDFSPCFLMNRLFQACGWEEPPAMAISSEMMAVTPVVHQTGRYYFEGELVDSLPEPYDMQLAEYYAIHSYRREQVYDPE